MTDYTDSILVKMFSRDNREDGEKVKAVKKECGFVYVGMFKMIPLFVI